MSLSVLLDYNFNQNEKSNRKKKRSKKKANKIKIGNVYRVSSFAGPEIRVKAMRFDNEDNLGFFGVITRQSDLTKLIESGVPFNLKKDKPGKIETFVYYDSVISDSKRRIVRNKNK